MTDVLAALTFVERHVIQLRFGLAGDPRTPAAVAKEVGLPLSEVTAIEKQALRKLRHPNGIK